MNTFCDYDYMGRGYIMDKRKVKKENNSVEKTPFFNSICFKIMGLVMASMIIAVLVVMLITVSKFKAAMTDQISTQLLYMAETERDVIDVETGGVVQMIQNYADILDPVSISGYETTNILMVTPEGFCKYSQ